MNKSVWESVPVLLVGNILAFFLGFATVVRVLSHVLGYLWLHPDGNPLEVEYGFDVRFSVLSDGEGREPDVYDIATVTLIESAAMSLLAAYVWLAGGWNYPPFVMWFLGINLITVLADPLLCVGSHLYDRR